MSINGFQLPQTVASCPQSNTGTHHTHTQHGQAQLSTFCGSILGQPLCSQATICWSSWTCLAVSTSHHCVPPSAGVTSTSTACCTWRRLRVPCLVVPLFCSTPTVPTCITTMLSPAHIDRLPQTGAGALDSSFVFTSGVYSCMWSCGSTLTLFVGANPDNTRPCTHNNTHTLSATPPAHCLVASCASRDSMGLHTTPHHHPPSCGC